MYLAYFVNGAIEMCHILCELSCVTDSRRDYWRVLDSTLQFIYNTASIYSYICASECVNSSHTTTIDVDIYKWKSNFSNFALRNFLGILRLVRILNIIHTIISHDKFIDSVTLSHN